ncbi:MAG: YdcF family protein [Actinomycetota bacterium]
MSSDAPDAVRTDGRTVRPRWRRRVISTVLVIVCLVGAYYGVNLFQVWSVGNGDQTRPVDAIVVLGAAQYDGRPSPQLRARLDHVVELWKLGVAPLVVVTGGNQPGDRFTEASASAAYLSQHGVASAAILQENRSHSSWESLAGVARLLNERDASRVLLVSDPFHSLRIRLVAQELGLTAYVSPTRTSPVRGATAVIKELKEAVGVSLGRVIGFKRLFSLTG